MTRLDWDQLAEVYASHGDPAAPENEAVLALARHDVEIERLQREHRL